MAKFTDQMKLEIATRVYPVWKANRPEASDRGIALNMLLKNLQYEEYGKGKPRYSMGTLPADDFFRMVEYWRLVPKADRGEEYREILALVEQLKDWTE